MVQSVLIARTVYIDGCLSRVACIRLSKRNRLSRGYTSRVPSDWRIVSVWETRRSLRAGSADESRREHASPLNSHVCGLNFRKESSAGWCAGVLFGANGGARPAGSVHSRLRKRWQSQRNVARGELAARPVSPRPGTELAGPFSFSLYIFRGFF